MSKIRLLLDEGGGKSRSHDTDDDSCERAKGTQDVLGSSAVTVVIINGARRVRAAGSAAGAAGGATGTWGSRGIWVGRPKGLYFERLRTSINLECRNSWVAKPAISLEELVMRRKCTNIGVVEDVCQLNGISRGSAEVPHQRGRDEPAAYKIREGRDEWERSGQDARVGVGDAVRNERTVSTPVDL